MPTLYLIDADSSQACPAVLAAMWRSIRSTHTPGDRLLLLGGRLLAEDAQAVGIRDADRIAVLFGKAELASRAIRLWALNQNEFGLIHCWSLGALSAATIALPGTPKRLTLVHRPTAAQLRHLRRVLNRRRAGPIRINTYTQNLSDLLAESGIHADPIPFPLEASSPDLTRDGGRDALRRSWGADGRGHLVVALLSDHASLTDTVDATAIIALIGGTLTHRDGEPTLVTLLVHPDQKHRQRAQDFLACYSIGHRVVQEPRLTCPWRVLQGCDAAMALGPDAGGLSLRWALNDGLPVIASANGPAGELPDDHRGLVLSTSNAHKDLAHALHGVLEHSQSKRSVTPVPS